MIYDCFTFFNEIDVLKIRLEELYPVVDKFVVVSMDTTFQGNQKPDYFTENLDELSPWLDKMIVYYESCPATVTNPWEREYWQRNRIRTRVSNLRPKDDDIIILGDADEIPRRADLQKAIAGMDNFNVRSLGLDAFYYGLNIDGGHQHTNRVARWGYAKKMTMQELRMDGPHNVIEHAGWHFSYLGDPAHIAEKFKAFAHSELNRADTTDPEVLLARMKAHGDLWGDGHQYIAREIDDTWPEAVKNNREYWRKYEW